MAAGNIADFLVESEKIITLERDPKGKINYLSWRDTADPETNHRLLALDAAEGDTIAATHSGRIALANPDKKTLLIIDPTLTDPADKNKKLELDNIAQAVWTNDGRRLIYSTGQAIYQIYFPDQQALPRAETASALITRYSQPIANIFLSDNWAYLFYVIENSLRVLEMNDPAAPQSLTLLAGQPEITQPEWVGGQKLIIFIDEAGRLQSLDLGAPNRGTGFFGN